PDALPIWRPDERTQPAVLPQRHHRARVGDRGVDLASVAHDAVVVHEPLHVRLAEPGDRIRGEAGERVPERRALAQDGGPAQARLEPLENESLEEPRLVVDGHTPLRVVILAQERVPGRPRRASSPVLAQDRATGGFRAARLPGAASDVVLAHLLTPRVLSDRRSG